MPAPSLLERVDTLEDEVKGLDSMIDSRTRKLWAEIVKLQQELESLKSAVTRRQTHEA